MFGLFKKKPSTGDVGVVGVTSHLKAMAYDIAPSGEVVAQGLLASGYNEIETASHIALVTMALDVKKADSDFEALLAYHAHALELLVLLKSYKDEGLMREEVWKNDATALFHITTLDQVQEEWVERVLQNDPIASAARMAISRVWKPASDSGLS